MEYVAVEQNSSKQSSIIFVPTIRQFFLRILIEALVSCPMC